MYVERVDAPLNLNNNIKSEEKITIAVEYLKRITQQMAWKSTPMNINSARSLCMYTRKIKRRWLIKSPELKVYKSQQLIKVNGREIVVTIQFLINLEN